MEDDFAENYNANDEENVWEEDDEEELSVDDIAAIMEGNKKTSPRKFATIVFAVYNERCSEQESAEMVEIIKEAEEWEIVDVDETDDPISLSKEREKIYDSLYEKIEENAANAIPEIEEQILKHPDEFLFYTLLTLAYQKINNIDKHDESIILTYQKFPSNIIAFTNYILIMTVKRNFEELKKLIGSKFGFYHFFPERKKISYEELAALAAALFTYFSEVTRELHKAVAYAMTLSGLVFYDEDRGKTDDILMVATDIMVSQLNIEEDFNDEINESPLRIVE